MRKLTQKEFKEVETYVYRNARPFELALWKYHFENGPMEEVLKLLTFYQNEDGGFGNSLEADNWNPESNPYETAYAISVLKEIDFWDFNHPIYKGIFDYLENTKYQSEDGWYFQIPSNNNYPHAVWWTYQDDETNRIQGIGTTAELCGFILRYLDESYPLYEKAKRLTLKLVDKFYTDTKLGDMGLLGFCSLCQDLKISNSTLIDLSKLELKTRELLNQNFNKFVWTFHEDMASVLPNPNLYYYDEHKEEVEKSLDDLIKQRQINGAWAIPWTWYDNGKYTREFAIAENWWKSYKAIEKLRFLKTYNRIEK